MLTWFDAGSAKSENEETSGKEEM